MSGDLLEHVIIEPYSSSYRHGLIGVKVHVGANRGFISYAFYPGLSV